MCSGALPRRVPNVTAMGAFVKRGANRRDPSAGVMTTIRAEVPLAELLTYSQSLTSLTGGRGDYHMQFLRYEEVPSHIAEKIIEAAKNEKEEVHA